MDKLSPFLKNLGSTLKTNVTLKRSARLKTGATLKTSALLKISVPLKTSAQSSVTTTLAISSTAVSLSCGCFSETSLTAGNAFLNAAN